MTVCMMSVWMSERLTIVGTLESIQIRKQRIKYRYGY